jgi:hypothetical protein
MHLSYRMDERDWQQGTRKAIIDAALSMYDVRNEGGQLVRRIEDRAFGEALFDYVQAISRIADVRLLSRERVRSTFRDDVHAIIGSLVPRERRAFDWSHPRRDPDGTYPVDVYVNGMEHPLFIYALSTTAQVRKATISLLKFGEWEVAHRGVGIFEDAQKVGRREARQFRDAADTVFSDFQADRGRLVDFLAAAVR